MVDQRVSLIGDRQGKGRHAGDSDQGEGVDVSGHVVVVDG